MMRHQRTRGGSVLLVVVALGGCAEQPALGNAHPAPAVLTPAVMAQLAPVFDVRAADEFFRSMPQEDADRVLADMGVVVGEPPAETLRVMVPVTSHDPVVQEVLDRMWAPSIKNVRSGSSDPALAFPGRAVPPDAGRGQP